MFPSRAVFSMLDDLYIVAQNHRRFIPAAAR